jgi:hypothetical protein
LVSESTRPGDETAWLIQKPQPACAEVTPHESRSTIFLYRRRGRQSCQQPALCFSLARLDQICDALEITLTDLMQAPSGTEVVTELAETQESALVSAPKVLVVMCLLVNDWKFQHIIAALQMEENELVNILLRLDRLRIIDYRPPRPVRSP